MTIAHRARTKSENFSYEAYASSPQAARDALMEGLLAHAAELNLEPAWPDETIGKCIVSDIASGASTIETLDLSVSGREVARIDIAGDVAWRSYCDMKLPGLGWGHVDGYGPTEEQARETMMAGVDAMLALGAHDALIRDQVAEDAETYRVRDGGAYRGGMIQDAGESLLDDHLPPALPAHSTDWLPTVLCTLEAVCGGVLLARAEATARPSRQNRMAVTIFFEKDLQQAMRQLLESIADTNLRTVVETGLNLTLPEVVVGALLFPRKEPLRREIDLEGGTRLVISFVPSPTTAESLAIPRDDARLLLPDGGTFERAAVASLPRI